MDLITAEHVHALSAAEEGSALVIVGGQARVVAAFPDDRDGYLVIGREDLNGLLGGQSPDQRTFEDLAKRLNSAVVEQGG